MKGLKIMSENILSLFDYDTVSEEHKKAVEEVINILQSRKEVPIDVIIEEIKIRFKIKTIPTKKIEDSLWFRYTADEKLGQSVQGYTESFDKDGNKILIPYLGFSADLNYLDGFLKRLISKKIKS